MGGICHVKGSERGVWYEVKCVKDTIAMKIADNQDAIFEINLLKSWAKYPDWEKECQDALNELGIRTRTHVDTRETSKSTGVYPFG